MLGGIAPIVIFNFPIKPPPVQALVQAGIPTDPTQTIINAIGIPIPIYLDEKLTGIYVESENKAIDIDTQPDAVTSGGKIEVHQHLINNLVTVNMLANRESILLAALLSLCDFAFTKIASKEYNLSYFNGATTVIGGLLHGFSTQSADNDDLLRIQLQISKANQIGTAPIPEVPVAPLGTPLG